MSAGVEVGPARPAWVVIESQQEQVALAAGGDQDAVMVVPTAHATKMESAAQFTQAGTVTLRFFAPGEAFELRTLTIVNPGPGPGIVLGTYQDGLNLGSHCRVDVKNDDGVNPNTVTVYVKAI